MKVRDLIELLKAEDPDMVVVCHDGPCEDIIPHSGPQRIRVTAASHGSDLYFLAKVGEPDSFEVVSL